VVEESAGGEKVMDAKLLPNGNMLVPLSAQGQGGLLGLGFTEVTPDDPVFQEWMNYYKSRGEVPPTTSEEDEKEQEEEEKSTSPEDRFQRNRKSFFAAPRVKAGFTGRREDALGRTRCYSNGVMVPCEQEQGGGQQQGQSQQQAPAQAVSALSIPDDLVQRILNVPEESKPYMMALVQLGQVGLSNDPNFPPERQLTPQQQQLYGQAWAEVTTELPPAALERVSNNVDEIIFVNSTDHVGLTGIRTDLEVVKEVDPAAYEELVAIYAKIIPEYESGKKGDLGCYLPNARALVLDGRHTDGPMNAPLTGPGQHSGPSRAQNVRHFVRHLYAHEMGHAIDGPDMELSGHVDWRKAWKREIVQTEDGGSPRLTAYARELPEEGFAEFCRVLYSGDVNLERVAEYFPGCSQFFQSRGLWPVR
jgi:hypothetical protein